MSDAQAPPQDFVRQVRNALAHLYDYAYLQNHSLAVLVDSAGKLDQVTRAQRLRRLLLDCIDALRPQEQEEAPSEAARAHAVLTYRYVDGLPVEEIAAKRALSERQAYRELEKGVRAVASLLQERVKEDQADGTLSPVSAAVAADDPLQTARVEAARLKTDPDTKTIDLLEVLTGVLGLLAPLSERTGVHIDFSAPEHSLSILADRVMLRQAFLNLLTHALNRAARGELGITVTAVEGQVAIEISATPLPGRTRPSDAEVEQARVGLTVAQALIEAQGGRLEVDASEECWSARVLLRAAEPVTILVIDDNQDLVALLQRYLAGHEVRVVAATEGGQALHMARELQPRLITLDVMMPKIDGWEILQCLKATPETADIPVIICSVLREKELAQTMGASDYITKPVRQADLIDALRRWLGRPQAKL